MCFKKQKQSVLTRIACGFVLFISSLWICTLKADLVIQINQGTNQPFPIAISTFVNDVTNASLPNGITGVIQNDLKMTGEFTFAQNLPQNSLTDFKQIDWTKWQKIANNTDYLLIGTLQKQSNGFYDVRFELISLINHSFLQGMKYQNIPADHLRTLAHQISDVIYHFITGHKGVFSTRLAYVEVQHPLSKDAIYQLIISDADGANPHALLRQIGVPIASPRWSPDGQNLAYVSYLNNQMVVYQINLVTGERQILSAYPGINSAPAYSPDGQYLALALSQGNSAQTNIYLLNLKNKKLTRLTNLGSNTSPDFSPNGQSIVFTSNMTGTPQIYMFNLKTKEVSRVTFEGVQNFSAVFSPNGQDLILMHQAKSGGPIRLARYNLNTDELKVLTTGELDKSPSIAPNGQMVIYANYDYPRGILAETSINGKVHLQLPATNGSVQSPAWSPF